MSIVDAIYTYLPAKRKQTPSGWIKFNAVCCHHNGNTADTRQRGGMIRNADGCSYHCFNCGYKASYVPGRHLTRKMRNLLEWLGAPNDTITKLSLEALKIESEQTELEKVTLPVFPDKPFPEDTVTLEQALISGSETAIRAAEYLLNRNIDPLKDYNFYVSESLQDRVIIPFYFEGRLVGYTSRKLGEGKPKYLSEQTPGYVFNLDRQTESRKFVVAVEGPMDAISIDAVAILGADIMDKQAMLINRLGKTVILVPDRDRDGLRTVEQAIDLNWSVSMPDWDDDIKDTNDAVNRYGKLWTLYSIIDSAESSALKIKLKSKTWFSEKK